jgi:hypothetical protein
LQEQVNGGAWATIQISSVTSKAISGKGNGTYSYKAQACNAGGCGPWSDIATTNVVRIPAAPTGLTATIEIISLSGAQMVQSVDTVTPQTRLYAYQLSASWAASTGATSYTLQYCQTSGACSTQSGSATSVSALNVIGAAYSVSVQACNASGCSVYSAAVTPNVVQDCAENGTEEVKRSWRALSEAQARQLYPTTKPCSLVIRRTHFHVCPSSRQRRPGFMNPLPQKDAQGQVLFCHMARRSLPPCPVHFALNLPARYIT